MRKIVSCICLLFIVTATNAQYKKASFLNKSGRTYDLGFSGRLMNNGIGSKPGLYYSYGRDKGARTFHWFDIEFVLPVKYAYNTYDLNNPTVPVAVSGKTRFGITYRYNFGIYFIDVSKSESKIRPFATAGLNIMVSGATLRYQTLKTVPEYSDPQTRPSFSGISYGGNIGIGGIYQINSKIGIKLVGGYNLQGFMDTDQVVEGGYKLYDINPSHPYVTAGVRFIMNDN
ncbi:MAG: hypothetical protein V9E88_13040 [Ferruginibacter sp.]